MRISFPVIYAAKETILAIILFDLDGTLLDTAPDIYAAVTNFLRNHDYAVPPYEEVKALIGSGIDNMVAHLLKYNSAADTVNFEMLTAEYRAYYEQAIWETKMFPHAADVLDELLAKGHRLGICTNKPGAMAQRLLQRFSIEPKFDVIFGPEDVPAKKPDPRHLNAARFAMGDGLTVFVGDSEADIEASNRAAIPFILFRSGYMTATIKNKTIAGSFNDYQQLPSVVAAILLSSELTEKNSVNAE